MISRAPPPQPPQPQTIIPSTPFIPQTTQAFYGYYTQPQSPTYQPTAYQPTSYQPTSYQPAPVVGRGMSNYYPQTLPTQPYIPQPHSFVPQMYIPQPVQPVHQSSHAQVEGNLPIHTYSPFLRPSWSQFICLSSPTNFY